MLNLQRILIYYDTLSLLCKYHVCCKGMIIYTHVSWLLKNNKHWNECVNVSCLLFKRMSGRLKKKTKNEFNYWSQKWGETILKSARHKSNYFHYRSLICIYLLSNLVDFKPSKERRTIPRETSLNTLHFLFITIVESIRFAIFHI